MVCTSIKYFSFLIISFFLIACGGGSSTPSIDINKDELIGTYNLSKFKVTYETGRVLSNTSSGVSTYFGSMRILSNDTFSQFIQIDEIVIYNYGTYIVNENNEIQLTITGDTYTVSLSLSGETLLATTALGASLANRNYKQEETWVKLNSDEPPSLDLADVNGEYSLKSFYSRTSSGEFYPVSSTEFSGTMSIDILGNFDQSFTINQSENKLTGQFVPLSNISYTANNTIGDPNTLIAHYDGKYFATYITPAVGNVAVNIWEKVDPKPAEASTDDTSSTP